MELSLQQQAAEAAATLLVGLGLGAAYELNGVVRRRSGAVCGAMADVLFCALFAAAMFLLGMGPGHGCFRLYMPVLSAAGAWCWLALFAGPLGRLFGRGLDLGAKLGKKLFRPLKIAGLCTKKLVKNFKNIFSRRKIWSTITTNRMNIGSGRDAAERCACGERDNEASTFGYSYEDRDPGTSDLCRG